MGGENILLEPTSICISQLEGLEVRLTSVQETNSGCQKNNGENKLRHSKRMGIKRILKLRLSVKINRSYFDISTRRRFKIRLPCRAKPMISRRPIMIAQIRLSYWNWLIAIGGWLIRVPPVVIWITSQWEKTEKQHQRTWSFKPSFCFTYTGILVIATVSLTMINFQSLLRTNIDVSSKHCQPELKTAIIRISIYIRPLHLYELETQQIHFITKNLPDTRFTRPRETVPIDTVQTFSTISKGFSANLRGQHPTSFHFCLHLLYIQCW